MNSWVNESIELANGPGYLDALQKIYPVVPGGQRTLSSKDRSALKGAFDQGNDSSLLRLLLKQEKFPIKDPYVAFLRKNAKFIEFNPVTVKRIVSVLRSLGFEEMMKGIEVPKEANRVIGPQFGAWLPIMGYPVLQEKAFATYDSGIAVLAGSGLRLLHYANDKLGANLEKIPDLVAKNKQRFVVGEAKFITDIGGHQNAQFQDALEMVRRRSGRVKRVAILDGVLWIKSRNKMYKAVCESGEDIFSALLLKDYLENL